MDNGFQMVMGPTTRVTGAGSQAGPALIPGNWYTITFTNAIRIRFADKNAAAPTAVVTDTYLPGPARWDFIALAGQEKVAIIDAAGGTCEAFFIASSGGG